jgi:Zn-dependent protease with chaperone function
MSSTDKLTSELIGVKANCKFAYRSLDEMHRRVADMLKIAEEAVRNGVPDSQDMLLKLMRAAKREITVAHFAMPGGNGDLAFEKPIENIGDWQIQITNAGKVRVHLLQLIAKQMIACPEDFGIPAGHINLRVHSDKTYTAEQAPRAIAITTDRIDWAIHKMNNLLETHNLGEWKYTFSDKMTSSGGSCNHKTKMITISKPMLKSNNVNDDDIMEIMLHEVAHAIVGQGHGHDAVWKQTAKNIGCSGKRCHTLKF